MEIRSHVKSDKATFMIFYDDIKSQASELRQIYYQSIDCCLRRGMLSRRRLIRCRVNLVPPRMFMPLLMEF